MAQPRIMPGMMGLANSQMWRNQKLMAALLSGLMSIPSQAVSTIGAEKRAPPTEGRRPRKAGILEMTTFVEEKKRLSASTMPLSVPDLRSWISRHITK